MSNEFDLKERTSRFGIKVVLFAKEVPVNIVTQPIIRQLVTSATSIGANYREADDAQSRKDFRHKIGIAKKETSEVRHWIAILEAASPEFSSDLMVLDQEAKELNLILNAIIRSLDKNSAAKHDQTISN